MCIARGHVRFGPIPDIRQQLRLARSRPAFNIRSMRTASAPAATRAVDGMF